MPASWHGHSSPADCPATHSERIAAAGHEVDVWEGDLPPSRDELLARARGRRGHHHAADRARRRRAPRRAARPQGRLQLRGRQRQHRPRRRGGARGRRRRHPRRAHRRDGRPRVGAHAGRGPRHRAERRPTCTPAAGGPGSRRAGSATTCTARRCSSSAPAASGRPSPSAASGFDMQVAVADIGDDLEAMLPDADFVSLHVPLTESTEGLIGREQLAAMKPTAILVNTARGPVIDRDALGGGAARGRASAAPRSTSPCPSRCRPTTRCCARPTCSSCRTSARPRRARARR